ncbi:MAG: tetratricopeptide repeat protein [bacterium]|nr:tetratricopeptide repeat protein [bacterium]
MNKYLLPFLCILGCAYYNTFYNAKDYYQKAIKTSPPKQDLLDKSIQRCEKIVKYYPKCKWVPDAIFLMGQCFLKKGEYELAERKFKELIEYYPRHRLSNTARLELGRTYIRKESYSEAINVLKEVKKGREEASKLVVDAYFLSKDYQNAIKLGKEFITGFSKSKFKGEVLTRIGNCYDSLKLFEDAIKYYEEAVKLGYDRFELGLSIGNDLLALNKTDEALQKFISLREFVKKKAKDTLELKIANCYRRLRQPEKAIEILEGVKSSPLALYEMGMIYEEDLFNLDTAQVYYENVRKTATSSELATDALLRSSRIGKLAEYREKVQDSTQAADVVKTQFLLAELYWVEFKKVDDAIREYERVVHDFPESEYAPKAAYSIAWLYEYNKDKKKAIEYYERVERAFPGTEYAESAKKAIMRLKEGDKNDE